MMTRMSPVVTSCSKIRELKEFGLLRMQMPCGQRLGHNLGCPGVGWGRARSSLLPGWKLRALRSPGSAVSGGPRDLNSHLLPPLRILVHGE